MSRFILVLIWTVLIFIFTCSVRLEDLYENFTIMFRFQPKPDLNEILLSLPKSVGADFVLRKIGHGLCFFIFTILLARIINNKWAVFIISFLYAGLTEVFQLFFYRDGRLFDIGFDTMGIIIAMIILSFPIKQLSLTSKSQT
jgi:VanZ family protein